MDIQYERMGTYPIEDDGLVLIFTTDPRYPWSLMGKKGQWQLSYDGMDPNDKWNLAPDATESQAVDALNLLNEDGQRDGLLTELLLRLGKAKK